MDDGPICTEILFSCTKKISENISNIFRAKIWGLLKCVNIASALHLSNSVDLCFDTWIENSVRIKIISRKHCLICLGDHYIRHRVLHPILFRRLRKFMTVSLNVSRFMIHLY